MDTLSVYADDQSPDQAGEPTEEEVDPIYYNALPNIMAVATCGFESVEINVFDNKFNVNKDFSAMYIVISDMSVVMIFVLFVFILERKQKRFEELYKDYMI